MKPTNRSGLNDELLTHGSLKMVKKRPAPGL